MKQANVFSNLCTYNERCIVIYSGLDGPDHSIMTVLGYLIRVKAGKFNTLRDSSRGI